MKKKVYSILHLIEMGLYLFGGIVCFKTGSWTWGLLASVLFPLSVYFTIKFWAWTPKSDDAGDDDKTKDLRRVWRDKF